MVRYSLYILGEFLRLIRDFRVPRLLLNSAFAFTCLSVVSIAQSEPLDRLPQDILDVTPPSARVSGEPGDMFFVNRECRPFNRDGIRTRIVNTAVQEWAYFGFEVQDLTVTREDNPDYVPQRRRRVRIDPYEAARVADSIAGYWSSTPNSTWILDTQNQAWERSGMGSRWRNPWSAAFISWVMCESGLGERSQFQRAIAHHSYIDQAIMARDDNESGAAFVAHDPGEYEVVPGDLLCRGWRPNYYTIAQRQEQMGMGARTHCDIVVKIDQDNRRIMAIGGNVRGWVRLKLIPASINDEGIFAPVPYNGRRIFAHLKLRAENVNGDALDRSPTVQSLACRDESLPHPELLNPVTGCQAGEPGSFAGGIAD